MRRLAVVLSLIGTFVIVVGLLFAGFGRSQASDTPASAAENPASTTVIEEAVSTGASQSTGDAPVSVAQVSTPAEPAEDSACIDCHSDAELLQLVAEEEEVKESLNEGSG